MLVNFLESSADFQASVNIGYDLNNKKKIKDFIPSSGAVSLLEEIMLSMDTSATNRAHILIGAYGKGKSHIVLSILSLLYHKDRDNSARFLKKINEVNPELFEYTQEYLNSDSRILPVIISGNSTSLTQAFLRALFVTLKEHDLSDLMPNTNYQMALNMIDMWENEFPEVYKNLEDLLPMPLKEFRQSLSEYNAKSYSLFEKLYPQLTAGNKFMPFSGYDVPELYEYVCTRISEHGYSGLYVVYDEFSKYLESSISKASIDDVKMLQDFAEKCGRSGKNQLHLLLISHKEIENYIDILPKKKVDGWRGVSERFSHISMQNDYAQTYEVIGAAIKKKAEIWDNFSSKNKVFFDAVHKKYELSSMFADCSDAQLRDAIVNCYPLHPITLFMLPRISEKVAQNERTLFTFVAGQDSASLCKLKLSSTNGLPFVTPDYLYDYFENQLRKEAYTSEIHQLYALTNEILSGLSGSVLEAKIVKVICLIYCIGQFNILAPTMQTVIDVFANSDTTTDDVLAAVDSLIKKRLVVYLKRSNAYLQLKRSSGIDVYAEIHNTVEKRKSIINPVEVLNAANVEPYLYPIRYNNQHAITRFFAFKFVRESYLENAGKIILSDCDGLVLGVIPESAAFGEAGDGAAVYHTAKSIAEKHKDNKQVVLVFPYEIESIDSELRMFDAVSILRGEIADDECLQSEYNIIYQDLLEVINHYIAQFIHPALHGAQYWYAGEKLGIHRKSHLTELLSTISEEVFPNTPPINNEIINRNKLTTVALNSRAKLLGALMQEDVSENLGLIGYGQDVSFMRSSLVVTGLLTKNDDNWSLNETANDDRLTGVLNIISEFFNDTMASGATSFAVLYDKLMGTSAGIGMRRGVIPIYIALCLRKYKRHFVIQDSHSEVKLTPALLNQINEHPESYTIFVEEWTDEKEAYTNGLADTFCDYVIEKEKLYGTYPYISLAMNRWYLSLPKFTKESTKIYKDGALTKIGSEFSNFIKLMRQPNIGAQELLFSRMAKCFNCDVANSALFNRVIEAKKFFDTFKYNLESELICETKKLLSGGHTEASLCDCATAWLDSLSVNVKNKLYSSGAERIISALSNPCKDEHELINSLARSITSLRIDDWSEDSIAFFLSRLSKYKDEIDAENSRSDEKDEQTLVESNQYSIVFVDENGNAKQRTFERTTYSKRAGLLYNRINNNLRDMGHSISQEEKRQVIMEILESLC